MSEQEKSGDGPVVIKKYANRRLYNTGSSSYVTLDDLAGMVKRGEEFIVRDAKTDEDLTRQVLTQIIFEEEAKGENLLPVNFLRQLIGFYGDSLQPFVPGYLEQSLEALGREQEKIRKQMAAAFGGAGMFKAGEEMARRNMEMFQQAMNMFNPLAGMTAPQQAEKEPDAASAKSDGDDLDQLKEQIEAMQRKLNAIAGDKK